MSNKYQRKIVQIAKNAHHLLPIISVNEYKILVKKILKEIDRTEAKKWNQ